MTDLDLRCALDPVVFARDKLHFECDAAQAEVLRSRERYVALNCCRQWGKSTVTAILALHEALYRGRPLILMLGPAERQSAELFRKVSDYVSILGAEMPPCTEASKSFLTTSTGARIVALPGSQETVRGFSGPQIVIVDEAARTDDDLYMAILPMIAQSGGRLILLSTPAGKQGFFYRSWIGKELWHRVFVPATSCPRISAVELDWQRAHMTANDFRQEFMGEFLAPAGAALDPDVIRDMFSLEVKPMFAPPNARTHPTRVISDEVRALA